MYGGWGAEGAAPWVPQPDPTATALGRSLGSSSSSMPAAAVQCLQQQVNACSSSKPKQQQITQVLLQAFPLPSQAETGYIK